MVSRKRPDNSFWVAPMNEHCSQTDGRRGVLRRRFGNHIRLTKRRQLFPHGLRVRPARDNPPVLDNREILNPRPRFLQHRTTRAQNIKQELRPILPRQRPQPSAGTAGRNNSVETRKHRSIVSHAPSTHRSDTLRLSHGPPTPTSLTRWRQVRDRSSTSYASQVRKAR